MKGKDVSEHWSYFSFRKLKTNERSFSFWQAVYLIGSQQGANRVKNDFLHHPECPLFVKDKDAVTYYLGEKK